LAADCDMIDLKINLYVLFFLEQFLFQHMGTSIVDCKMKKCALSMGLSFISVLILPNWYKPT